MLSNTVIIYLLEIESEYVGWDGWMPYGDICYSRKEAENKLKNWIARDKRWKVNKTYRISEYERRDKS